MTEETTTVLRQTLQQLRQSNSALAIELRRANEAAALARRSVSSCVGGVCSSPQTASPRSSTGGGAGLLTAATMRSALEGDWRGALQGMLSNLTRSLTTQLRASFGGGLGGSLLSGLVGGGLSMLLGKLFAKPQKVSVDNTVRTEVLNFPRLSSLDFASNPASRLFSGRAVARGPAFSVQVEYRGGAEELVTAKVASRLADINFAHGLN